MYFFELILIFFDSQQNENGKESKENSKRDKDDRKDKDRERDGDRDRDRRDRDKDRDRDRDRDRESRRKDRDRDGRDKERDRERDRDRDGARARDRDRSTERRDKHRSRDDSRERRRRRSVSSSRSRSGSRRRHRRHSRRDSRSRSRSPPKRRSNDRRSSSHDKAKDKEEKKDDTNPIKFEVDMEAATQQVAQRDAERKKKEIEDLTKDQRTIFVSQLTKKVAERDLENFFGQLGKVKNVIMLRDKFSGAHKGFAYVEMEDLDHIPNCLLFNNVVPDFQKFPILVKPSEAEKNFLARKDPFSKQYEGINGPDTRIYLGNIHVSLDENALKAVLEQFGPIESVKLHRDHLGNSKGFAFVKFLRSDSASLAMAALPGLELAGRPLKVGHVTDQKLAGSAPSGPAPSSFSSDPMNASGNWKLDADDGGAGLALNAHGRMMLMAKLAQNAGIQMPVSQVPILPNLMNNPANPAKPVPVVSGTPSRFVLVSNMFDPTTETGSEWVDEIREDVSEECSNFGPVEHCYVEKVKPGGLVFVTMKSIDAATKAANALNGRYFAGRMITCTFVDEKTYKDMTR